MSGDKCLKIHIGVKCHLASNVTCLLVVKCLWRQLSQPLTGIRGLASKVWATNVLGVKQLESAPKKSISDCLLIQTLSNFMWLFYAIDYVVICFILLLKLFSSLKTMSWAMLNIWTVDTFRNIRPKILEISKWLKNSSNMFILSYFYLLFK